MHEIKTVDQFRSIQTQERVVVFLWVDWSIYARDSARIVEQMIDRWNCENPTATLELSRVDLSSQSGDVWDAVAQWLAPLDNNHSDISGILMMSGSGSLIWVRSGRIVRYVLAPLYETVDGLVKLTSDSFVRLSDLN